MAIKGKTKTVRELGVEMDEAAMKDKLQKMQIAKIEAWKKEIWEVNAKHGFMDVITGHEFKMGMPKPLYSHGAAIYDEKADPIKNPPPKQVPMKKIAGDK